MRKRQVRSEPRPVKRLQHPSPTHNALGRVIAREYGFVAILPGGLPLDIFPDERSARSALHALDIVVRTAPMLVDEPDGEAARRAAIAERRGYIALLEGGMFLALDGYGWPAGTYKSADDAAEALFAMGVRT